MHSSTQHMQRSDGAAARGRAAPKAPPGPVWFTVPNLVFMALFLLGAMLVLIDVSLRVYEAGGAGVTDQRTVQNYTDFLFDPYFLQIVWRSVVMAVTVVLSTLVLGLPLAIGLSRTTGIWRALLYFAVLAPLLTSVVVRTFGWMMLLSNNGFINSTLRELEIIRLPIRMMYQMTGVDIVMTHVHLPFMVLALDAALLNINPQVYEAARNLGAGAARIFFRITLPLCMPGIVAGRDPRLRARHLVLCDARPDRRPAQPGDRDGDLPAGCLAAQLALRCGHVDRAHGAAGGDHGAVPQAHVARRAEGKLMLKLVNTLIILFLMAPLVAVIGSSITTSNFPTFPPEGATLKWYAKVLNEPAFTDAMLRSLVLGLASAAIAGLLGTLAAVGLTRLRGRTQQSLTTVILSPILLPTVVLGLALLIFYNRIGLQGTFAGLVAAHVLLTTPFVVRLAMASLSDFDISMEEAARNLGAGPVRAFVQITLPQILPGVIAGVIFAFILSFDELVVTLFLAGPEMQTLPIRIYTFLEYQSEPTISAVASIIILIWMALGLPLYARLTGAKKGPSA